MTWPSNRCALMRELDLDLCTQEVTLVVFGYSFHGASGIEVLLRNERRKGRQSSLPSSEQYVVMLLDNQYLSPLRPVLATESEALLRFSLAKRLAERRRAVTRRS